ncbi:cytochrome p450 cyp72a219 [Quercus suber]|uniref:Cytochrome p450 cyp72a219 n=1 Tax=Quercus suber TaxID=58331 RepID=A0AAW0KKH2_QUESU
MEISLDKVATSILFVIMTTLLCMILNWVWLRPKYLERCLRKQGLVGNSYRLFFGDTKDGSMMIKQACSKPIELSDDIVPRVLPFEHHTVKHYATFGPLSRQSPALRSKAPLARYSFCQRRPSPTKPGTVVKVDDCLILGLPKDIKLVAFVTILKDSLVKVAVTALSHGPVNTNELHKVVMNVEGFEEDMLDEAFDHLVNDEKAGRAFMAKNDRIYFASSAVLVEKYSAGGEGRNWNGMIEVV